MDEKSNIVPECTVCREKWGVAFGGEIGRISSLCVPWDVDLPVSIWKSLIFFSWCVLWDVILI